MRIRFALLLVLTMVAVSACGPKYVGMPVNAHGIRYAPMSLAVGETGDARIYLKDFSFNYRITRTGETTYSMKGSMCCPSGDINNGSVYLLLIRDEVVVGEQDLWPRGDQLEADFESPEFDHITSAYSMKIRRRY